MAATPADAQTDTTFATRQTDLRARIDAQLSTRLQGPSSSRLSQAMRYALLAPGKRLRPLLAYATAESLGAPLQAVDHVAAAVEAVHAYSLIHDDLPAMDDDDLRRGQPTCHVAFDEGIAILAGDALQALAFEWLAAESPIEAAGDLTLALARACGAQGMAGGQAIDIGAAGQALDLGALTAMHRLKTGALISASMAMAARVVERDEVEFFAGLGFKLGLAFQIQDDVLDLTGNEDALGKPPGSDVAKAKPTFPQLLGLAAAREMAKNCCDEVELALQRLGNSAMFLRQLAAFVVNRDH